MTNQILDGYNGYAIEAERKILQLENENARLRDELERLKSVVGEVDFYLIDECLKERTKGG